MRPRKTNLKGMICAVLSGAMILASVAPASAATARATTMKLEKTEGTVTLKTQNGSARKISKGMRLYNGNTLATAKYSYAHISLDSTKAVKLDQSSSATLRQSGNQLELLVKSGKLFFDVSKKLSAKESMNVRTSTMVTGVRGTCGVVEYVNQNKSKLYLIEGQVTLGTGQNATVVQGGQTATVVLQPKQETGGSEQPGVEDKPGDPEKPGETDKEMEQKVMVEKLTEKTIPPVALQEIVANPVLQEKIKKTTELKIEKIEEALEQFEKEEAERIEQEKAEQEKEEEQDKEQEDKKENENTSSSGEGSYTPSTPVITDTTLTGTVSAAAITAALASYNTVTLDSAATAGLEADVTIPEGKILIVKGNVTSPTQKTYINVDNGTLVDTVGSVPVSNDDSLLCSISQNKHKIYAKNLNAQVAAYINDLTKSSSITASFQNEALVTSNITLSGSGNNTLTLSMSDNTLKITAGTLTLGSEVTIEGAVADNNDNVTAVVMLSGGNLVMQGTSQTLAIMIKNSSTGNAIARTSGELTWNDTGMSIQNTTGIDKTFQGTLIDTTTKTVQLPGWVHVKAGYAPIWDNSKIVLQNVPSSFTSGTVTVDELNRSLIANQTVTFGTDAQITLNANDNVTVPAGKVLVVQAKITENTTVSPSSFTYGFNMKSNSVLNLKDGATLKVTNTVGMNGIINVGNGATVLVENNGWLQADAINLTNGSSLTNQGTIDGGTLSLEGTGTITNHTLIKMKTCVANEDSNTSYSYVDENDESILVLDGDGFSDNSFTGISQLACVMASTGSSDTNNSFETLVSVYAKKLNQRAANLMRGNQMINEKQVVHVNVSKDVEVMDNITWDLAGASVGMYTYKVNVAKGKQLELKNIASFGGVGETLINVGNNATLTITWDNSISVRDPFLELNLAEKPSSVIYAGEGATVNLADPGLIISVIGDPSLLINGMTKSGETWTVPDCVKPLDDYKCNVEYRDDGCSYLTLVENISSSGGN